MMDVSADTPAAAAMSSQEVRKVELAAEGSAWALGLWQLSGLLLATVAAPSLVWILLDQTVWPFDQAWYGQVSVELFAAAVRNPSTWPHAMLGAFGIKAPGIAWFGQLFVPFGVLIGSVEDALLVYVLLTQLAMLVLVYLGLRNLTNNRVEVALTCCLFIASTPLFVGMSHEYFVEPLQTLAVAWFIVIMAYAKKWSRQVVWVHLLAATSLAMLAKGSSPLYDLAPGLVALVAVMGKVRPSHGERSIMARRLVLVGELATAMLVLATIAWYALNFSALAQFTLATSSGAIAAEYGSADTFSNKIVFWLESTRRSFFLPPVVVVLALVAAAGVCAYGLQFRRKRNFSPLDLAAVVALVEIALVLGTFSVQVNQETRYLQPVTPYVAVLLAWLLTRLDLKRITQAVALVFAIQLAFVYRQAFALAPPSELITSWVVPLHTDSGDKGDVDAVVALSCEAADIGRYNMVGVELPWFNANSLSFFAAKRLLAGQGPCFYTSLGYAESDPERAWNRVLTFKTDHYLTVNFALQQVPSDAFNRTSSAVLERVQSSGLFQAESLPDHLRVVAFRRTGAE